MLKQKISLWAVLCITAFSLSLFTPACVSKNHRNEIEEEEEDGYDGIEQATLFEIERTKDPALGRVPTERLWQAIQQTEQAKSALANRPNSTQALVWEERGPNGDFTVGGNPRPTGQQTSGRIRAIMVDSTDPTHKTVWAGGVDGGLWKTNDITVSPSPWVLVNDYMSNLAIAAICQDPRPGNQNIMYFCTGESFRNADAVRGVGVFKSVDGGATWNFLSSTSSFLLGTRIVCDYQGNVYCATRTPGGLWRSSDGGTTWTNITPTGVPSQSICDLEISSTSGPARLHMVTGIGSGQTYRYTDNPATATSGSGWNAPTTPFPGLNDRCEIAVMGNTLYALPVDASSQVPTIYKSTDGGDNWAATGSQPASGWASGQGWYSLSCGINPSNPNECIVGGLDCYKTTNGGTSWTKISGWATSTTGFYIHADQHNIQWWDGGSKLLFACDGGLHYSIDGGINNNDRNKGLRLKQFYSVAISPTQTNYFIGGAQDNGMHRMNHVGLDSSAEVVGGDGAYCAIDQLNPVNQFGSYVYNVYRRSTNAGASWSTPVNNQSTGRFINPWDFDNNSKNIYACNSAGNYLRWDNAPATGTTTVVTVAAFSGVNVSAVHCSPYTANRVYFGMGATKIFIADNANTNTPTTTEITPSGASGYVNCVVTGKTDDTLMATYASYGVGHVWYSVNGGTNWTKCDGNLPDMPVRWALFHPDDNKKAYIATETGVWETDLLNGASTVWIPNTTFPNVRTDMIKYRASDRLIAAATHGRGIFTTNIPASVPTGFSFTPPSPTTVSCPAPATMDVLLGTNSIGGFSNAITVSAVSGVPSGTTISFVPSATVTPGSSVTVRLNNANTLTPGTYNVTIQGTATGATTQNVTVTYTINGGAGPAITTQPSNQTVCAGGTANFSIVSAGATNFQWQVSTDGGGTWNNISGATTANLSLTGVTAGMNNNQYRCIASTGCGVSTSNAATLTVNVAAAITGQPANISVCSGSAASFSVTASNATGYQWQLSTDNGATWNNISGATSATYTIASTVVGQNGNQFRCIVTSSCPPNPTSNAATLTVSSSVTVTTNPVDRTICEGTGTTFTAAASGTGLSYQWEVSTNGGVTWTSVSNNATYSGATTTTLTLTNTPGTLNQNRYRCNISSPPCAPGITASALLTVNSYPVITTQPVSQTFCEGSNATLTVGATTSVGALSYQWQASTNGGTTWFNVSLPGANTNTLAQTAVPATQNGYQYRCVVTAGCGSTNTNAATFTVNSYPNFTLNNLPKTICLSDAAITLTASVAGGTWSGTGVTASGVFTPSVAGVGIKTVTYTVAGTGGCPKSITSQVQVYDCADRHKKLNEKGAVRIISNPNNGNFSLKMNTDLYTKLGVKVFGADGKLYRTFDFDGLSYGSVIPMKLTTLAQGTYFLYMYNSENGFISRSDGIIIYH